MKRQKFPFFPLFILCVILTSFTPKKDGFEISVKGKTIPDIEVRGLKTSELSDIKIEAGAQHLKVQEFELTLTRGEQVLTLPKTIKGNSYDLSEYSLIAKEGDRFVIIITDVRDDESKIYERIYSSAIIVIPVKV